MDNDIAERTKKEIDMMEIVFKVLTIKDKDKQLALDFFDMASNYFKDSKFFLDKQDYIRAFEAVVISWSYIDAGIKADFFEVPKNLKKYFTS
ncbi:MAG: Protein of unknown function DUF357 [Candidatus Parvarchaeum acidiphilum ARMAN-4]|jgi:hypothetical protein|uniref:DUF357 domain-containing protein n=1 Tax=Candidatus Parvarchaeum acidiphilum ARMAN-4 TaxID=662760 RepID=D2EF13_PARA4|nr:MAG: Protein of unknown function DUF357 [Candidatus Parvarchaeum acidiphilum ARMAN-4]